jgi:hypothetical protein
MQEVQGEPLHQPKDTSRICSGGSRDANDTPISGCAVTMISIRSHQTSAVDLPAHTTGCQPQVGVRLKDDASTDAQLDSFNKRTAGPLEMITSILLRRLGYSRVSSVRTARGCTKNSTGDEAHST